MKDTDNSPGTEEHQQEKSPAGVEKRAKSDGVKAGEGSGSNETSRPVRSEPTPIPISPATRTVLLLAVAALLFLLVWLVPDALVMLLGGAALALVLSFPVSLMQRVMPRGLAILLSFLLLVGILALAVASVIPIIGQQLSNLVQSAPSVVNQAIQSADDLLQPLEDRGILTRSPEELLNQVGQDLRSSFQQIAGQIVGGTIGVVSSTVGFAVTMFGVIFISAYLLLDTRRIRSAFVSASPRDYRRDVNELWDSFSYSLSRYLGGLALSMTVQGLLSAVALYFIGVPYALLLGVWVALTAVLPYIGAWLGAVPAVLIALSVSPTAALITALLFLGIQQLEGNFLTPRIQSGALGVHPIIVFLAVIVGSGIFGILGAIFAVPTLAVVRVLFDFFRDRLQTSRREHPIPIRVEGTTAASVGPEAGAETRQESEPHQTGPRT